MISGNQEYWSIDVPGLTSEQAEELLRYAESRLGLRGTPVDPGTWLTRHLDVQTVAPIVRGLSSATLGPDDLSIVGAVMEDFQSWLEKADRPD